ncbi:DUF3991 domain-containing protein [Clostridium cellulovorans]|uniref:Toprim sub domain-containing protein n=1 Tax=Clostridium cellulovorans (strain ATCC 35296 / DSM 3052 / OCM 3 / 743B) TaxID=573061 RepID=D9SPS9_CLOC7|nr:DUF3991 domain-containing protein [Clostridium cellulovorans]ADL52065.1 Toprim sub domain-containing protein [Clostridium cellulovorans 743B]
MKKQELLFTDEEIARANDINIISYATSMGYNVKQATPRTFKIEGFGGLYINADGRKWNWFSQNMGGGIIQFVMQLEGRTWVEAVKHLLGNTDEIVKYEPPEVHEEEEKGEFILPEKNNTYKHIFAYLIHTRGIDKAIVNEFVQKHKIYENTHKSCVFLGYDKEGVPKYASIRSTNTVGKSFRCDVKNSDKSYPFSMEGKNKTLCIFEAPIDLLSYLTLIKLYNIDNFSSHCISLGGVSDKALEYYLKENPNIDKIMLCLDNDEAGHFACKEIYNKYKDSYEISRHKPKSKDFNEDLLRHLEVLNLESKKNLNTLYCENEVMEMEV